jgi:hypothetical protein
MEKIFENWREFRKAPLNERTDFEVMRSMGRDPISGKKMKYPGRERWVNSIFKSDEDAREAAWLIVQVVDPTGVTGLPDLKLTASNFKKNPSVGNAGWLLLSAIGVIPAVGYLGRGLKGLFKAGDWAKYADEITDATKALDAYSDAGAAAAAKAKSVVGDAIKASEDAVRTAKGSGRVARSSGALARIAGHSPQINKAGQKAGVFYDGSRAIVTVSTEAGPVSFMFSSGTSLQMLDDLGRITSSPRVWFPVGDVTAAGRYKKYAPQGKKLTYDIPDPRFGTGNKEVWDRLLAPLPRAWDPDHLRILQRHGIDPQKGGPLDWLANKHGNNWSRKIWTNGNINQDVDWLISMGYFRKIADAPTRTVPGAYQIGKYASPDSAFGRIASEISKLSPDGNITDELIDMFGPVVRGGDKTYNAWRAGNVVESVPLREHVDTFQRWRKIALIHN